MSQKYPGGFITKSPVAPTALVAKGMWTLDQAMQLKKQGTWPSFAVPGAPTIGTATQTGPTTAAAFITSTGAEAFTNAHYWSSTEVSAANASPKVFDNGQQAAFAKTYSFRVRAVRRIAV